MKSDVLRPAKKDLMNFSLPGEGRPKAAGPLLLVARQSAAGGRLALLAGKETGRRLASGRIKENASATLLGNRNAGGGW